MGIIKTGLKALVAVKTADVIHERILERQDARWATQGQAPGMAPPAALHAPSTAAADDVLDQLSRLGGLRDNGVLTDAEFETQKAKILTP
jgi:hypothetical protein